MADENTLEEAGQQGETQQQVDYKALYESEKANAEKWKALSRKNEEAYKKATAQGESDQRIKELEDRAAKAEQEASDLRAQKELADTMEAVAKKLGIPAEVVCLVKGATADEIEENANKLRALLPTAPVIRDSGKPSGELINASDKTEFVRNLFNNE